MRTLRWILLALWALVGLALVVSLALPRSFEVERRVTVAAAPARVRPHLALERWAQWAPEARAALAADEARVTASVERGVWLDLALDGRPAKAALRLEPAAEGTAVIWSVRGELRGDPVARWLALGLDGRLGPPLEAGLARLARAVDGPQEGEAP